MIQKPIYYAHSGAVVATDPETDERYGASYQTILWASLRETMFPADSCGVGVL
jgi:hypothetical protein